MISTENGRRGDQERKWEVRLINKESGKEDKCEELLKTQESERKSNQGRKWEVRLGKIVGDKTIKRDER